MFFAFSTTSSIGVPKLSLTKATPILLYGLEAGFPKILKSVLGKAAIFSIPVKVGLLSFLTPKLRHWLQFFLK